MGTNFHGIQGSATYNSVAIDNVIRIKITFSAREAETTAMHASNRGKTRNIGQKGATAEVEAYATGDLQATIGGTAQTLLLKRTATVADGQYSGSAICEAIDDSMDRYGNATVIYRFRFTDSITYAEA